MSTFSKIATRGWSVVDRRDMADSDSTLNMMIGFLGIVFFSLCLVSLLVMLRRIKMQRLRTLEDGLPKYKEFEDEQPHGRNINRLNIHTADGHSSVMIVNGRPMLSDPASPPDSPNNVPEIHITFPDESDAQGRQQNGRVVVVRVGETSIGLEPYKEDQLPAYQKDNANGFYSIDMNQIGGLKEKDSSRFQ